jgi:hypothetical protein
VKSDKLHRKGGADIRTKDNSEGLAEAHEPGAHEPNEHDRRCAARLNEAGDERSAANGGKAIARERPEKRADLGTGGILKPVIQELDAVEQEEHAAEKADEYHERTMPIFSPFVNGKLQYST